jgi:polysaccharide biosynthesis transport protein
MLQRSNVESVIDNAGADSPQHVGLGQLVDLAFGFLRRQYLVILLFALIAAGTGATYIAVTPPTYTARAKVIIGTQKAQFIQQQSLFTDGPIDSAQLESQLQILQSKAIASSVLDSLNLLHDPEFAASGGGSMLGGIRGVFAADPNAANPDLDPREAAIAAFADRLTAGRVGFSHVIEIGFSSRNPERAAQVANAVANAYIIDQLEAKSQVNRTAGTWLQERLQQLGEQGAAAERAVLEFKQQNNIVEAQGRMMDE